MMIVEEDIVQISLLWNAKLQDVWIYCSEMNKIMNLANEKKTIPIGEKVSANRAPIGWNTQKQFPTATTRLEWILYSLTFGREKTKQKQQQG